MDSEDVIVLDSSDEEADKCNVKKVAQISKAKQSSEHNNNNHNNNNNCNLKNNEGGAKRKTITSLSLTHPKKRIKPIKLGEILPNETKVKGNLEDEDDVIELIADANHDDGPAKQTTPSLPCEEESRAIDTAHEPTSNCSKSCADEKTEINVPFRNLLEACRAADPTSDMELLINKKLIRYYESVHPDFCNSKSFCKNVERVTNDIKQNPGLVYLKITGVIEELKVRRKSKSTVMTNEEVLTTGNEKRDKQIKKLNKALYILKKRITKLEESDVDLNDDNNSSYLLVERYKKRAMEIYEKICDLTGESKHAHRSLHKPITFQGTAYPEFNKTVQTLVNKTNKFPDFVDVLKCLQYCNRQYNFRLKPDEIKKIAEDAFIKIGRTLQNRRKTDLYETVTYYVGTEKDPAIEDHSLETKLSENKKYQTRISTILDKFVEEQEKAATERKSTHDTTGEEVSCDDDMVKLNAIEPTTSANCMLSRLPNSSKDHHDDTEISSCNSISDDNSNTVATTSSCSTAITKVNGKFTADISTDSENHIVILDTDDNNVINSNIS